MDFRFIHFFLLFLANFMSQTTCEWWWWWWLNQINHYFGNKKMKNNLILGRHPWQMYIIKKKMTIIIMKKISRNTICIWLVPNSIEWIWMILIMLFYCFHSFEFDSNLLDDGTDWSIKKKNEEIHTHTQFKNDQRLWHIIIIIIKHAHIIKRYKD